MLLAAPTSVDSHAGAIRDILTRNADRCATPAVLQATFKRYLPPDRYTLVTLVPARSPESDRVTPRPATGRDVLTCAAS